MVARLVRDQEAVGSNPATSTIVGDFAIWSQQERVAYKRHPFLVSSFNSSPFVPIRTYFGLIVFG